MKIFSGFQHIRNYQRIVFLIILYAVLSACGMISQDQITPSPTPLTTDIQPTATLEPLGSSNNLIVMGLIGKEDEINIDLIAELEQDFFDKTQTHLEIRYYEAYQLLLVDMRLGKAHLAWLPPATYLFLHDLGAADVSLLTNHFGVYMIGSQIVANRDSGFTSYFDPIAEKNTADISRALSQFEDERPCWVNVNSLSGYLVPLGLFIQNDIPILDGVYTQNHTSVIRTLYIRGVCDFGATFALSGDPRTSSVVLDDLTDALDQITVIYRTEGIIPNNNLSYSPLVPAELRSVMDKYFLELARAEQGRASLSAITNYEINGLMKVDDSIYARLRELLNLTGVDLSTLAGW